MFKIFCTAGKRMKFATKPIQHYLPHLTHVATLPWEIKSSNFLQMWKKTQSSCILITSSFVIHSQFLLFPHTDCKYNFPCDCSLLFTLRLICGTGNSSHCDFIFCAIQILLLTYLLTSLRRHCNACQQSQHGIQRRGQDFDKKKFAFEGVHSKEADTQISWEKLDKTWC